LLAAQSSPLPGNSQLIDNKEVAQEIAKVVNLERYDVSANRINGLVNQSLFITDGTGPLAFDVMTRTDLERLGVTSIEDVFRFVPQTSDYGTALQASINSPSAVSGLTYQNSEVKLRGFSSLQTTILINGRRLQRGNSTAGPDLNRIPMSAIERIEILPSSASALYGGGAIGGAINIIMRKGYVGRELTVKTGGTTDGGGGQTQATYYEGRSFNNGKTQFSFSFDYQHNSALLLGDRDYLQRALDRYPEDTAARISGGWSVFEQYLLPAFAGIRGGHYWVTLLTVSGLPLTSFLVAPQMPRFSK
jgi:outer membrane cobalamin receptor